MAGELITYDGERLSRSQRQTFAEFGESPKVGRDAVDRIEATMSEVIADCRAVCPGASNLLSGGVDSSYLQARWNKSRSCDGRPLRSFAIVVDHARTRLDEEYSLSSARALGVELVRVPADGRYSDYLVETLSGTGEPPNHVQAVYFGHLARTMAGLGVGAGICGEGADSLFGVGTADAIRLATAFRKFIPVGALRRFGASLAAGIRSDSLSEVLRSADWIDDESNSDHPLNRMASFSDWDSVSACFGGEAVAAATAYRRGLLDQFRVPDDPLQRLHAIGFLGEAVDSASFWKTLFNHGGIDLLCPFLDSRIVQLAMNIRPEYRFQFRRPKELLKKALSHHVPAEIAYRRKLGFGQPIFEWMSPGGQLRPLIERIGRYDFVPDDVMARACRQPNWFLYSLLCYDLWHKIFIEKSLPVLTSGPGDSRRLCHS
jgi:asparagine synthetase B (glutamine-hydrolysing)